MKAADWIADFAGRLGVEAPSPEVNEQLLALAATAAHASERTAAPIACYLAARSGLDLRRVREMAAEIATD